MSVSLDDLIIDSVASAFDSTKVQEFAKNAAEKAIQECIERAFNYNSDFRKSASEAIATITPAVRAGHLTTLGQALQSAIVGRLSAIAHTRANEMVGEMVEAIFPPCNEIGIQELREEFESYVKKQATNECHCDYDEDETPSYRFDIEWSKSSHSARYGYLYLSEDDTARNYDQETIRISFKQVDENDPTLVECWGICTTIESECRIFSGPVYGFPAMLVRLRSGIAKLRLTNRDLSAKAT